MVTPTASGKTLCYNAPVLNAILQDPSTRALYLFPTKALAQDQLAELYSLIEALGADIGTFTYDGDTPQDARKAIRARAHIVVTNPDMLHKGILPHHTKWVKLFENLKYVVVDEKFFRPAEVDLLVGDASKARDVLGWKPQTTFEGLVNLMVDADLALLEGRLKGIA